MTSASRDTGPAGSSNFVATRGLEEKLRAVWEQSLGVVDTLIGRVERHAAIRKSCRCCVAILLLLLAESPTLPVHAKEPGAPWLEPVSGQIITVVQEQTLAAKIGPKEIAFFGVSGLDVDPQSGYLYLIDKARHMVFRVDTTNGDVYPFAGEQTGGFNGDGRAARDTIFHVPSALGVDRSNGDVYIADTQNHRIRLITRSGSRVTTVAGAGIHGLSPDRMPTVFPSDAGFAVGHFSGDDGPATEAELNLPSGIAIDNTGVLFIADSGNHRIRAVNRGATRVVVGKVAIAPGQIRTVAGTGVFGFAGDGGEATAAKLAFPAELKVDSGGNVYFVDTFNERIRRLDRKSGIISTAVLGQLADLDPESAKRGWKISIMGLALTADGSLIYSDRSTRSIYRLPAGGSPAALFVARPRDVGAGSVAVGADGTVFVADVYYNRVLKLKDRAATLLAGGATEVERVAATNATLSILGPIAVDSKGDLYIADAMQYAIRRIRSADGVIETFMGTGKLGVGGDGGSAAKAELVHPTAILIDGTQIYVADQYADLVRKITQEQDGSTVETFAGRSGSTLQIDGIQADAARLGGPLALARNPVTGEIYIACQESHSIRKVGRDHQITTIAGKGRAGNSGGQGWARDTEFNWPAALVFDRQGSLYVSDMLNHRILKITGDGRISRFAGSGSRGFAGDGGPAVQAQLDSPGALAFDVAGNLYVSDTNNQRVRRIDARPPYRIQTVVGNGLRGFSGDGGPPTEARLNLPRGLAFGPNGVLYIADSFNRRVRAVRLDNMFSR